MEKSTDGKKKKKEIDLKKKKSMIIDQNIKH